MITKALWIIAICEIIRTVQLTVDIAAGVINRKTLNNAFIDSLKQDNREWTKQLLEDFIKHEKCSEDTQLKCRSCNYEPKEVKSDTDNN